MLDAFAQYAYKHLIDAEWSEIYLNPYDSSELNTQGIERAVKWLDKHVIYLPLFLYDHSGITISTAPFSCRWDSGQVGFVFVTKDYCKKELGVKTLTPRHLADATKALLSQVEAYDNYLTGSVYYYSVKALDIHCGGFYGSDHNKSGLFDDVRSEIFGEVKSLIAEQHKKLKKTISIRHQIQNVDRLALRKPLEL